MTSGRGAATKIPDVMISKICDVIMDGDGEHNDLDRLVESALEAAGVGKLIARLIGAGHALRSYQYENTSTEFAKEQADAIDVILAKIGAEP